MLCARHTLALALPGLLTRQPCSMLPAPTITLFAPQPRTDNGHLAWLRDRIREEMRDYFDAKISECRILAETRGT